MKRKQELTTESHRCLTWPLVIITHKNISACLNFIPDIEDTKHINTSLITKKEGEDEDQKTGIGENKKERERVDIHKF